MSVSADGRRLAPELEELFLATLDQPPGPAREAWLATLRKTQPHLAETVMRLLAADERNAGGAWNAATGSPILFREQTPERIGTYQVLSAIGQGSMGAVFEAVQSGTGRRCAVKLLRPGLETQSYQARLQREAEFLGRLNHPGIAQVYDAGATLITYNDGTQATRCYLAMEYVSGGTLLAYVQSHALNIAARVALVQQAAEAVYHSHLAGLIHRDLKPDNLLVNEQGLVKIVDFGIARLLEDSPQTSLTGTVLGTPGYMSPEQTGGLRDRIDTRTDVYALGATLYALLAERPPDSTAPVPIRQLLPALDRRLAAIIGKAMALQPEERYASAELLAVDLRHWSLGVPILAPAYRIAGLKQWVRAHIPLIWPVAVAALLLLVLGVALPLQPEWRLWVRAWLLPAPQHRVRLLRFEPALAPSDIEPVTAQLNRFVAEELMAGGVLRPESGPPLGGDRIPTASGDLLSPAQLAALRTIDAPLVLAGEFDAPERNAWSNVEVRVRLINTKDGHTVAALSAEGSLAELEALAARLCRSLSEPLGGPEQILRSRQQNSAEAARLLAKGTQHWLDVDLIQARTLLERAVNRNLASAGARLMLARVLQDLGYRDLAMNECLTARQLADTLNESQDAEALYHELSGNWLTAIRLRHAGADDELTQLALTGDLISVTQVEEAGRIIAQHKTPAHAAALHRWQLADLRHSRESRGRPGQLEKAKRMVAAARASGPALFLAESLDKASEAYTFAGLQAESIAALQEARQAFANAGDREGMIREMAVSGQRLQITGSTSEAIRVLEQALRELEGTGFAETERYVATILGQAYGRGYDLDLSRKMLARALAKSWKGQRQEDTPMILWRLGIAFREGGQLEEARRRFAEAVPMLTGRPEMIARTLNSLGELEVLAGRAQAAREAGARAEQLAVSARAEDVRMDALTLQARARLLEGNASGIDASFRLAVQKARERGMAGSLALAEMQWGEALLRQQAPQEAETHLAAAVAQLQRIDRPAYLAQARALLAMAYAGEGWLAAAREECALAVQMSRQTKYAYTRVLADLAQAMLAARQGRTAQAAALYTTVYREATSFGFAPMAAQAQAALGTRAAPAARTGIPGGHSTTR